MHTGQSLAGEPADAPSLPTTAEVVDTWNLVLDHGPAEMLGALEAATDGVDAVNEQGYTCLMWAALYGKEEHALVLLECGADVAHRLEQDYYSKTYPAGSTAVDIAVITEKKTGADRQRLISMLTAAADGHWSEWKAEPDGAAFWAAWQQKWAAEQSKQARQAQEKVERARRRRKLQQRAVDRVVHTPLSASTAEVGLWLRSVHPPTSPPTHIHSHPSDDINFSIILFC